MPRRIEYSFTFVVIHSKSFVYLISMMTSRTEMIPARMRRLGGWPQKDSSSRCETSVNGMQGHVKEKAIKNL
jgi:hypothetical protein